MTTLIAVYTSQRCVGRYDARCHNATKPSCDCVCGGRYHGLGAAARARLDDLDPTGELRHAFAATHHLDERELRLQFGQTALFRMTAPGRTRLTYYRGKQSLADRLKPRPPRHPVDGEALR
jgi:hypothetical protein